MVGLLDMAAPGWPMLTPTGPAWWPWLAHDNGGSLLIRVVRIERIVNPEGIKPGK